MRTGKVEPAIDATIRDEVADLAEKFKSRKDLSRETASLLFFRYGIYPSVQLVHSYTKLGSLTDINKDLDEFWRTIREKARVQIQGVGLPEDILTKTGEVLGELWSLALEKANESLAALTAETLEKVDQARLVAQHAEERMELALNAADQAKNEAAEANQQREHAERLLAVERNEKNGALQQVAETEKKAAAAIEARRQAEAQFSADLQAERQARQQSEERLAGELRFAKLQIEEARETGRVLKERLTVVESDRNLLEAQLKRQISSQHDQIGELRLEVGELRGRNAALTEERNRLIVRLDEMAERLGQRNTEKNSQLKKQLQDSLRAQLVTKPSAFELVELLEVELAFETPNDDGGDDLLYLGMPSADGLRAITPKFTSLDELENFCTTHMERYEGLDLSKDAGPSRWFWEKD